MKELSTEGVLNKKASLGWLSKKVREKTIAMIDQRGRILDVGCGNALFLTMLGLNGFDRRKSFGMDFSEEMLEEAREVSRRNNQDGIHLLSGDFFMLPFKDGTFESITLLNTTMNLEDKYLNGLLKEMARVLSPSGRIYLDIRNGENPLIRWRYLRSIKRGFLFVRAFKLQDFIERLNGIGLTVFRIEYVGPKIRPFVLTYLLEISKEQKG